MLIKIAVFAIGFLSIMTLANPAPAWAQVAPTTKQQADDFVVSSFKKADKDNDQKVTLAEFLVDRVPAEVAKRDFQLVDFNADGALTAAEFAAVPSLVEPWFRGPMPDPMLALVDSIATALEKALGWNTKPDMQIDAESFVTTLAERFGPVMAGLNVGQADTDRDGRVSRAECRRFLEMLFGIRRTDGKLLREPNGRVVNYMLYLYVDLNRNDQLEKAEFMERAFAGDQAKVEFDSVNADGNDVLSFEEWCQLRYRGMNDPIMEFREMDKNLDAFLSPEEVVNGTPDWKRHLAKFAFPGFDLNRDGKLSLSEYRLTLQANPVLPWQNELVDQDGDNTLALQDFRFENGMFPLLHLIYFRRLDTNSNGKLEVTEFQFRTKTPDEFFTLNEDGTGWKSFYRFEGRPACGSPAISPDGKQIAFDAWPQGQQNGSAIYVMDINGSEPKQICLGMMPSWSSDSKKVACSRSSPAYGAWVMDLAGVDNHHIGRGWGAQFSPDGKRVAFTDNGPVIKTWNAETEEFATVFDGKESGYQQIFWNMSWSPNGKQICFKAIKTDKTQEVAMVDTEGDKPNLKVLYTSKNHINADFAWHPTSPRIVFSTINVPTSTTQLFEVDPTMISPPVLLRGQDPKRNNTDACWTPDGKRLIVISGDY